MFDNYPQPFWKIPTRFMYEAATRYHLRELGFTFDEDDLFPDTREFLESLGFTIISDDGVQYYFATPSEGWHHEPGYPESVMSNGEVLLRIQHGFDADAAALIVREIVSLS